MLPLLQALLSIKQGKYEQALKQLEGGKSGNFHVHLARAKASFFNCEYSNALIELTKAEETLEQVAGKEEYKQQIQTLKSKTNLELNNKTASINNAAYMPSAKA